MRAQQRNNLAYLAGPQLLMPTGQGARPGLLTVPTTLGQGPYINGQQQLQPGQLHMDSRVW